MKNKLSLFFLLSGFNCYAQVVADEVLTVWEFESNPHTAYLSEFCVGSKLPLSSEYQGIRAIKSNQDQAGIRHRFTLGKEVYRSVAEAVKAVAEINQPPRRTSKHEKMCDIRQAFNLDQVLYFVHTDVANFKPEINAVLNKLKPHLQQIK